MTVPHYALVWYILSKKGAIVPPIVDQDTFGCDGTHFFSGWISPALSSLDFLNHYKIGFSPLLGRNEA
jgi:hypothetical protein